MEKIQLSARLLQFVTPAVVFNQPPQAACTANSLLISPLSLFLSVLVASSSRWVHWAVTSAPDRPLDLGDLANCTQTHAHSHAHAVYMMHTSQAFSRSHLAAHSNMWLYVNNSIHKWRSRGVWFRVRFKIIYKSVSVIGYSKGWLPCMEILSWYWYHNNFANNKYNTMFQGNKKKLHEKLNETQVMYVIEHRYELNFLKSQECDFHHSPV